ncbi:MAG: type II secretion system F family protein [Candidatus Magasanikbacteria bacterium]|nr:type II secretion system F family protein [Candidatus Magasanikbacteria bacterium]
MKWLVTLAFMGLSFIFVYNLFYIFRKISNLNIFVYHQFWPSLSGRRLSWWERTLLVAGMKKIMRFEAAVIFGFVIVGILLLTKQFVLVAAALAGAIILMGFIINRGRARKKLLIKEIPEALGTLSDTMKSGLTFIQAVELLSAELPEPMRSLFKALQRGNEYQLPLGTALLSTAGQVGVAEWTLAARVLARHSEAGGNILPTLEALAEALRDRAAAAQEIKSLTAAGRLTGLLITALMPITLILFSVLSPSYVAALFTTTAGKISLLVAGSLEVIGIIWIYFILKLRR